MLTRILAASALTIGLATAAMAQSADTDPTANVNRTTPANPSANEDMQQMAPDPGITGSITTDGVNADPNCQAPLVPQPDAPSTPDTPRTASPTVTGNNCGQ